MTLDNDWCDATRIELARLLSRIQTLTTTLDEAALAHPNARDYPGGDALNLAGPAANLQAWENRYETAEHAGQWRTLDRQVTRADGQTVTVPPHADYAPDQADTDDHPLLILATWEDVIRDHRNQPTDLRATVTDACGYIRNSLDWLLDKNDTGYPNFLPLDALEHDLRRVVTRMENTLKAGTRHEWDGVNCLQCGTELCRRMLNKTGIEDDHWCFGCRRNLAPYEWHLAMRQHAENQLLADAAD